MKYILILVIVVLTSCNSSNTKYHNLSELPKSNSEWKAKLSPLQYHVMRENGTERAFTGEYTDHFEVGNYSCSACNNIIFTHDLKYESTCGWPSFDSAIQGSVTYKNDFTENMKRIEVRCAKCDSHLGHVFDDGPTETTGKRYCINSVSLKFNSKKN